MVRKKLKTKFAVIGFGAMGSAIALGLIRAKKYHANDIIIFDADLSKLKKAKEKYGFSIAKNAQDLLEAKIILIAVKPNDVFKVLYLLKKLPKDVLLISIAAGIKIEQMEKFFPKNPIVRVMPNTPAQIGKGISAIAVNKKVSSTAKKQMIEIFKTLGEALILSEKNFNAVTALSGSGPAYVFLFIEAMIEAGIQIGLAANVAKELAIATVYGSGILVKETKEEPTILRERVTSKGGTTEAALNSFAKNNFNKTVVSAVGAAYKRAQELSTEK